MTTIVRVYAETAKNGELHGAAALRFFVFPRGRSSQAATPPHHLTRAPPDDHRSPPPCFGSFIDI